MCQLRSFLQFFVVILAWSTMGCDETVDAFLESDRNVTLFGTLDLGRDTQYVRVIPIRERLDPGPPVPLDITFTSEDINSGERVVWRDSIITFGENAYAHVFYAPLRLRPGHAYRIEVVSPDQDAITAAETVVPSIPTAEILDAEFEVTGAFGVRSARQTVIWKGIPRSPFRVDQYYRFQISIGGAFRDILLPYEPRSKAATPTEWDITLDLLNDKRTLDTLVNTRTVPMAGLGQQLTMLDPAFVPPGGFFNPEVLSQPGTMSNVENGFGFVGSVGRFSVEWVLPRAEARQLGYATMEDLFAAPDIQELKVDVIPVPWTGL